MTRRAPRLLAEVTAARLRAAVATGAAGGDDPAPGEARERGRRSFERSVETNRPFDEVAADLLSWRVHAGAGLRVEASDLRVRPGVVALLHLGIGPVGWAAPVRVVDVVREPGRVGFTYVTLAGHPEAGVESFEVVAGDARAGGYRRPGVAAHPPAPEDPGRRVTADVPTSIPTRPAVTFGVRAVSRPATFLTRAGGPVARAVQDAITTRYLRAAAGER